MRIHNKFRILVYVVIILIIVIALLFGYKVYSEYKSINMALKSESKIDNEIIPLTMEIKEVDRKKAVVIITDLNEEKQTYGPQFRLEHKVNGKWEYYPNLVGNNCGENKNYFSIGYTVGDDHTGEMTYYWYDSCGELPNGIYRVSHNYGRTIDRWMSVEFILE